MLDLKLISHSLGLTNKEIEIIDSIGYEFSCEMYMDGDISVRIVEVIQNHKYGDSNHDVTERVLALVKALRNIK